MPLSPRVLLCGLLAMPALAAAASSASPSSGSPAMSVPSASMVVLSERADRRVVRLANGLVVIVQRVEGAPVASVQCTVKTGSVYERHHNGAGLSHFLEHLLSGGTTARRPEAENNRLLGLIGAQMNASTSLDQVNYYINTAAEHAPTAIDLISDWMQNNLVLQEEFERERDVIQREFDMGRGEPGRILWLHTQLARYRSHPARHPTIGYLDEFLKITRKDLYDFYKQMYVPNNMVFTVAGLIDPDAVVRQVADLWKDAKPGRIPGVIFPKEPPLDHPVEREAHADVDRPRLRLAWPGTQMAREGDYALDLAAQVLGEGELSRLVQSVRNTQRLVSSVDAYNVSFAWGEGFFGIDALVEPDKLDQAKAAILAEVERIKVIGVTEEELRRAKRKTISAVVHASQTAQGVASRLAGDFFHAGDPDYLDRYAQAIEKVTIAQVQAAIHKHLVPQRLITVKLLPNKAEPEHLKRAADQKATGLGVELVNLDNATLVEKFKALPPLEKPASGGAMGAERMVKLPNGLRVIVQRNPRLPIVSMQWYQLGGLLADAPGREGVANAAAEMLMKGAGDLSADDIARQLEELGASLNVSCGNSTWFASGMSLTADWKPVLELLATIVQNPTCPAGEWDKLKPRLLAAIATQNDQWHTQLRNAVRAEWFGRHPWSQSPIGRKEVVESLTAAQIRQFHLQWLDARNSVVAVFGDIDEEAVLQEVQKLFGRMPASPEAPFPAPTFSPPSSRVVQVATAKPLAAVQIAYGPGLRRNDPDYPAMLVMDRVLSNFPVGWFEQELRGRGPGLVYAVGSGMATGYIGGYWAVMFNTQPKTVGQAMARAVDVVARIRNQSIDAATLERARTAVLVGEALGRQSNGQRATNAALDELYGLGFDDDERFIQQIRSVTAEQIHAVAGKYLTNPLAVILSNQPVPESEIPSLQPAPSSPSAEAPVAR
jgi:zinc protease